MPLSNKHKLKLMAPNWDIKGQIRLGEEGCLGLELFENHWEVCSSFSCVPRTSLLSAFPHFDRQFDPPLILLWAMIACWQTPVCHFFFSPMKCMHIENERGKKKLTINGNNEEWFYGWYISVMQLLSSMLEFEYHNKIFIKQIIA